MDDRKAHAVTLQAPQSSWAVRLEMRAEPAHAGWRTGLLFCRKWELQLAFKAVKVTGRDV